MSNQNIYIFYPFPNNIMYTLSNWLLKVTSSFIDKETGETKQFTSSYKINSWVKEETLKEWLDNQNPDYLNKNIKDYLVTQGIAIETGSKKLINEMLNQMV